MRHCITIVLSLLLAISCSGEKPVILGDDRTDLYIPLLQEGRVAIFSNHTGILTNGEHVLDVVLSHGINVTAIFSPEHGFRGDADAGEHVGSSVDPSTGVPILSLYGSGSHLPTAESMDTFDILLIDIQDVGLRYYTYYITMCNLLDACSIYGKKVVLLDRPNPNGFYVDGPILDMKYKSGVGGLPIPIVHGMTLGELALMVNGEGWLPEGRKADITVIPCENYTHSTRYELPVAPSPNLKDMRAIYLYASTCYFEGARVSLGRGTDHPFEMYGAPGMTGYDFSFTPQSLPGAKNPPFLNEECHGVDLRGLSYEDIWREGINFSYVVDAFQNLNAGEDFFLGGGRFFRLLTGVDYVYDMLLSGATASEIEARWQDDVTAFKQQRRPYLLYKE